MGEKKRTDKSTLYEKSEALLIRLFKKLVPNHQKANDKQFDYIVWSAFDGMKISTVNDMADFYINNGFHRETIEKNEENLHRIYEEQRLCLYHCSESGHSLVEPDYRIETNSGVVEMPLIVLTEIKLNDEYIASMGLEKCQDTIEEVLGERIKEEKREKTCTYSYAVYRSLGYSDFVIIFRSYSYDEISNAVKRLRRSIHNENREYFIRSTYSILGIAQNSNNWGNWDDKRFNMVSIRIALKPSTEINRVVTDIRRCLNGQNTSNYVSKTCETRDRYTIEGGTVFGKYDVDIIIKAKDENRAGARNIISLYTKTSENGCDILNPGSKYYKKNIYHTSTRWISSYDYDIDNGLELIEERSQKPDSQFDSIKHRVVYNEKRDAENLILKMNRAFELIRDKLPESLMMYLQELLYCYERLSWSPVTCSLLYELSDVFKTLFHILIESSGYIPEQIFKSTGTDLNKSVANYKKPDMCPDMTSLKLVIKQISELIRDRLQASRPLFEAPSYNIKFLGSIAKIIMAYSAIINTVVEDLENCLRSSEQDAGSKNIGASLVFFLTIELSNQIHSHLFFNNSLIVSRYRLVSISCDITSFFYLEDAVSFIMHEIGHYTTPFEREKCNRYFLRIICSQMVELALMKIFKRENPEKSITQGNSAGLYNRLSSIILDSIEEGLHNLAWLHMEENCILKKNSLLDKFADDVYIHVLNALREVSESYIKSPEPKTCNQKKQKSEYWRSAVNNLFSEKMEEVVREFHKKHGSKRENLARILASCWLHENTPENQQCLVCELIKIFETSDFKERVVNFINLTKKFFSEVVADIHMCRVLGHGRKEYRSLAFKYFKRAYGKDILNVESSGSWQKPDYTLLWYARVIMVTSLLNPDGSSGFMTDVIRHDDESRLKMELILMQAKKFLQFVRSNYMDEYIKETGKLWDAEVYGGRCNGIRNLMERYRKMYAEDSESRISRQLEFVEYYWQLGLRKSLEDSW